MSAIHYDDRQARLASERLARALNDLRWLWPAIVPVFIGWMREQFGTEGAFGGQEWAPLSPAYAAWKTVHFPGRGILYATGDLRQASSRPTREATERTLTLGVKDPTLEYHQEGNDKMPARPLLFGDPLPFAAREELERAIVRATDELVVSLRLV